MVLSDKDIKHAVKKWEITISDFENKRLQPTSYDILLWNEFLIFDSYEVPYIDPVKKIFPKHKKVILKDDETFILHPNISILWLSLDHFWSDKYLIQLSWKSSLARIWLIVHNTAWVINIWHYLNVTFELCNLNCVPIVLTPKMEIAQLLFHRVSSDTDNNYKQTGRFWEWCDNFKCY